jgi:peptide/nickel transport system substrate-binding protein
VHPNPQPATIALFLNTRVPPFNQLAVRRAVNYAADREAAVEANGGPEVAQATCQVLPPHFPGYRPYCPYGTQPDLAKARALVRASGTTGMRVTFWSWAALPSIGPYAVRLLQSLGYRVSLRTLPVNPYFGVIGDSRNRAAAGTNEWISDYPAPGGFIAPLFTCSAFKPRSSVNQNTTEFCDPKLDRQIEDALGNVVTDPEIARRQWERVDRAIVDEAVWVPLVNPKQIDVVSKRVGNYQSSPNGAGIPVDQLWVR